MNNFIDHTGTIIDIIGNVIKVQIKAQPACQNCYAKKICSTGEEKDIIIDINTPDAVNYKINESVKVLLKLSTGYKAIILAYIIPLLLVLLFLLVCITILNIEEVNAGMFSITVLFLYYLLLYYFRNKIKKKFTFELMKLL